MWGLFNWQDVAVELLLYFLYDLRTQTVFVKEVNDDFLFGSGKGKLGWIHVAFSRMVALRFMASVGQKASASDALLQALAKLAPGWRVRLRSGR